MKKLVIYTAVTGSYDNLNAVNEPENICDYICFTDYKFSGNIPKPWRHIRLPPSSLKNKDLARFCKLNPHLLLPQYSSSVWIDGNITIKNKISNFVLNVLNEHNIASYQHWGRDSTEQEFYECSRYGFDFAWKLKKQIERYEADGYVSVDFFENNVIFRNHMLENIIKMHNIWWSEYWRGGKRDQYSFTYSAFKVNESIFSLGEHDPRVVKKFFDYQGHAKKRPILQTFIKIINRVYIFFSGWRVALSKRKNLLDD